MSTDEVSGTGGEVRGRPRSERSRRAVLDAASELLVRDGFAALTVESIARRAGVSKATIYRWWSGKAAIVLDAVLEQVNRSLTPPDTDDARELLVEVLQRAIRFYTTTDTGSAVLDLVAASRHDPPLARALENQLFAPRREAAASVVRRQIECGRLRSDLDVDLAVEMISGPLDSRILAGQPIPPEFASRLLDQLWPALAPTESAPHR